MADNQRKQKQPMTTQEITNSCRPVDIAALNLGQSLLFNCPKHFQLLQNIQTVFSWIVDLEAGKAPERKLLLH